MSRLHIVKVTGKTIPELIKGLRAAIAEYEDAPSIGHSVEITSPSEDEYEEVQSPFTEAPVGQIPGRPTVIDNEVDSEGIPWDSRIHASTKTKVSTGAWKRKKGVSEEEFFSIKQELRARVSGSYQQQATPAQQQTVTAPMVKDTKWHEPQQVNNYQEQTQPVQNNVLPGPGALPQMNQNGHTLQSFQANFAHTIATLITQGKLTSQYIQSLCQYFGVNQIWEASPDQQATCFHEFVKNNVIVQVG